MFLILHMIVFHFLFQVFAAGLWDYSPLCDQPCTPGPARRRSSVPRPLWRGFLRRSWARSCPRCSFLTAGRLCPLLICGTAEDRAGGAAAAEIGAFAGFLPSPEGSAIRPFAGCWFSWAPCVRLKKFPSKFSKSF